MGNWVGVRVGRQWPKRGELREGVWMLFGVSWESSGGVKQGSGGVDFGF